MSHSGSLFAFLRRVFCVSPIFSSRPQESMCMGLSTVRIDFLFEGDQCSRLAPALDSQGSCLFGLFYRSGGGGSFLLDSRVLSIHLCLRLHFMSSFQVFICVDSSHYPSCYPCLFLSISLSLSLCLTPPSSKVRRLSARRLPRAPHRHGRAGESLSH